MIAEGLLAFNLHVEVFVEVFEAEAYGGSWRSYSFLDVMHKVTGAPRLSRLRLRTAEDGRSTWLAASEC